MLCQKCGKHEATYHYTSNINGQKTEVHLCPECAAQSEYKDLWNDRMFAFSAPSSRNSMFGDSMFGDFFRLPTSRLMDNFFKGSLFGGSLFPSFDNFFSDPFFKALEAPAQEGGQEAGEGEAAPEVPKAPELSEKEQLKAKLNHAIEAEEYEEAAKIRDQIRAIDKNENHGTAE